ncbi:HNH endonuclease signature motif containing protein [Cellulomonas persica]|uniref:HNH nuclease domain-containing protein n=1 Tax=Cellulomonas persica TaxID=76861 RepID=A0A510USH8_9CELL|nr:HNH endonuclease signature motif containing protein [Cellulomonas persica]GEK17624.1 hypothetical protein CPE01_13570 [Cellulomonas persica]
MHSSLVELRPAVDGGVADDAARVGRAARELAVRARDAATWQQSHRHAVLARIDEAVAALTAAKAHVLQAEEAAGTWQGHGDRDLAAWRGRGSRAGAGAAGAELRDARILTSMPELEDALLASELSPTHVGVLARVAARATPAVTAALASPAVQGELVALGRRLDGREYARAVDRFVAQADPVSVEREHAVQRERRHLFVTDLPSGTRVQGMLDARAGHRLRLALEAAAGRPAQDDVRTAEQRRADALVALAEHALAAPETASGAASRPHVSVVLGEQTFRTLTRALHDGPRSSGQGATTGPGATHSPAHELAAALTDVPAATDEDGAPVPASEVARLLCDCALTRVVMDAESRPLDVGRTQRLYSGHLRRAVIARDGGCAWDGCGSPARWCEVHHIRWWDRDRGPTSVENGVLLCSYHHHVVHERDLTIVRHAPPPLRGLPATGRAPDDPSAGASAVSSADSVADSVAGSVADSVTGAPPGGARSSPFARPVGAVVYTFRTRRGDVVRSGLGRADGPPDTPG